MPRKIGHDPTQIGLFAVPLEAMISADAEVRVIAAFVDQLDLVKLGFKQIKSTGVSAYGPDALLKLYIYGYLNRVRSSRRLERECKINIEVMWLTGRLEPCYHTIADFHNATELAAVEALGFDLYVAERKQVKKGQSKTGYGPQDFTYDEDGKSITLADIKLSIVVAPVVWPIFSRRPRALSLGRVKMRLVA